MRPMRKSVFRLDAASVKVGGETLLSDFSLELYEGEIMGVVGASNSGKSSLCKLLAGAIRLSGGALYYRDQLLRQGMVSPEYASHVWVIEQGMGIPEELTVEEWLALVNPGRRGRLFLNRRQIRQQAVSTLATLSIRIPPEARLYQLSVAQRHMVCIAAAWMQKADLVVLNNTVSGYTDPEWEAVKGTLRLAVEEGIAALVTCNRENRLVQICDHVAVMGQRTSLKIFEPADYPALLAHMRKLQRQEMPLYSMENPVVYDSKSRVLCVRDISTDSLNGGGMELYRGEIVGVYDSDNVAGQELFSAMMTMAPTCGHFELEGVPVERMTTAEALRRGVAFMPEHAVSSQLFRSQSALDNVLCASKEKLGAGFLFRRRAMEHLAATSAERIGIEPVRMSARVERLDHMGRLRVYLSRWDYVRVRLMVCNCPLETSDLQTKEELKRFLRSLAEKGAAVCLFGYNGAELLEICDSLYRIERDCVSRKYTNSEAKELLGATERD